MEKTYDDNEIEIDLLELLGEFRRRIWMIIKGDNTHLPGRPADRKPDEQGL